MTTSRNILITGAAGAIGLALREGLKPDCGLMRLADIRDLGALLQRAGFALPVVDVDEVTLRHADPIALVRDLRAMGSANALAERSRRPVTRRLWARLAEIYAERFADPDGRVRTTLVLASLSGWAPHPDQPRPLAPGSGRVSLTRVLPPRGS